MCNLSCCDNVPNLPFGNLSTALPAIYDPKFHCHVCETLPDKIPETPIVLIHAPPRVGKTHRSVQWMCNENSANYVTHSHSVARHAAQICSELMPETKNAVHLEGKKRCCSHLDILPQGCESCSLYPFRSEQDITSIQKNVKKLLKKNKLLCKENIPATICPYYALKIAEPIVDYCFTAVQSLNTLQNRDLLVLDEDSTVAQLYPHSIQIADRVSTKNQQMMRSLIGEHLPDVKGKNVLDRLHDRINETIESLDPDDEEITDKLQAYDALFYCIDIIRKISNACDPQVCGDDNYISKKLNQIDFTIPECDRILAYDLVKEITRDLGVSDAVSPLFEPILFPYENRRFHWAGSNHVKLFMIANERYRIADVPDKTRIVIIGDTRADLLVNELDRDCTIISVPKFPFSDQFVLVSLPAENAEGRQKMMKYIFRKLNPDPNDHVRVPSLVLTSSKKEQERLANSFKSIAVMSEKEGREGQRWNHASGGMNVFYTNSVISRGIDVEFYDMIFIYGSDFANPYYEALRAYSREEYGEDDGYARDMICSIAVDETTNCLLRISPTKGHSDKKARIAFIAEPDMDKIRSEVREGMKVVSMNPYDVPDSVWKELRFLRGRDLSYDQDGNYRINNTVPNDHRDQMADHVVDLLTVTPQEVQESALSRIPVKIRDEIVQRTGNYMKQRLLSKQRGKSGERLSDKALVNWMIKEFGSSRNVTQTIAEALISHMVVSGILRREEDLKSGKTLLSYRMRTDEYDEGYWFKVTS